MIRNVLFCILALGPLFFTACSPRETNVESGNRTGTLHLGIGHELPTLDPHLATGTSEQRVLSALFEGLVAPHPEDLHPVPGVAASWHLSADQLTYTFKLRPDARWSNGDPVTSRDFAASFQRVLTPAFAAPNAALLHILQGAQAYHLGRSDDFSQVGVQTPDDHTLVLTLQHPAPYFLTLLSHPAWYPVHLASISLHGAPADRANRWATPGRLVGNGPFTLTDWKPDQRIVVGKNPAYWDAATVTLQAIHFYPIDSLDAEERAFRSGQLHLTEALPPGRIDAYRRDHPELLRIDPYLGTYFLRINTTRPFLNQREVRLALSAAIDREAIVDTILRGGQLPADSLTPPGTAGYLPPEGLTFDPEVARKHLAAAGYPGGQGAPQIELLYNTSETHRQIAEAIQAMWSKELGLRVRLSNQELAATLQARATGDYELLRSVWIGDYADPSTFLELFTKDSTNNFTGWTHADYDRLLYRAARTTDNLERFTLLREAELLLLKDTPVIPLYHYTHVFLKHPSVKGWHPTLLDHHPYKHVRLEPTPAGLSLNK
ncbi:MAG: peptide ABC transporter substrate-binding protein [Verrucomicrobiota bacterium]